MGQDPPDGIATGPPVLDDADPRLLFQDAESEALRPFWAPVLTLSGAATLGELVRHRRIELGLGDDIVPELAGIERDSSYLPALMPARELAALMRRLRIRGSRRLGTLTRSTLEALQPSLARGAVPSQAPSPDAYVQDLLRVLEEEER
jgi:hypothetical protein